MFASKTMRPDGGMARAYERAEAAAHITAQADV
jgi:hypothetical protein